ncbi:MAG TPA: gliding motility-associated C-terminal domain-containing protein, partial [Chitinophagales bacterium]|nr:gliding motility-associated C-terminal domain-containing protein [Chitinophagales bacterium]
PQNKRYWHSAAESAGFATPTYLNSENEYHLLGNVHIIPEVFSPDGDGYDDEAKITYSFDEDGSVVNVYLYNAAGQLANHLVKDEAIAKEGAFVWNGDDENGSKKDVGIYFLVFERKKPDGEKIIYKRKCVLAAKLN